MLNIMKKYQFITYLLVTISLVLSGCANSVTTIQTSNTSSGKGQLYIYPDGRMMFRDRFVDQKDVVIYPDGTGGERAAVKVRVPIHPDFYRDSIVVVRVINVSDESVTLNEANENQDQNL